MPDEGTRLRTLGSSDNQRGFRNQPRPESQRHAWPRGVDLLEPIEHEEYAGRQHIAVSTPFLLEVIKARRPQFTVKVGIYAQVDTPRRAKFWEDLGADAINLESFSINRDFSRLAAIREAVRCDLQLIANHCCLPNCPLQSYHQNGFAHSSDGSRTIFIDYCFLRCSQMRLEDPSLFIKSAWIRPEDLSRYEAMGYTTFKLIERGMPSAELLKRVAAYSARRFDGNLAELLLPYCFEQSVRRSRFWMLRYFFKPFQLAPHKLLGLLDLVRSQGMLFPKQHTPVHIDASQIPSDFLEAFEHRDCAATDCNSCGYCETISRHAVRIEPEHRRHPDAMIDDPKDFSVRRVILFLAHSIVRPKTRQTVLAIIHSSSV